MTEAEWLTCQETWPLLTEIRRSPIASDRKVRLLCLACCHRLSDWLRAPELVHALAVAERLAEGKATPTERKAARRSCHSVVQDQAIACAAWALQEVLKKKTFALADAILPVLADARHLEQNILAHRAGTTVGDAAVNASFMEQQAQCELIRDVFGSLPFRYTPFDPEWRTSSVTALARQMYDSRDFSAMPILADALQDAGCENADVLDHCRGPGPHVRGCWVVDLVLGRS